MIVVRDASDSDRSYLQSLVAVLRLQHWGASSLDAQSLGPLLAMQVQAQERSYREHFPQARCRVIERGDKAQYGWPTLGAAGNLREIRARAEYLGNLVVGHRKIAAVELADAPVNDVPRSTPRRPCPR